MQLQKQLKYYKDTLQSAVKTAEDNVRHIDDLVRWTKDMMAVLTKKMSNCLPQEYDGIDSLLKEHIVIIVADHSGAPYTHTCDSLLSHTVLSIMNKKFNNS